MDLGNDNHNSAASPVFRKPEVANRYALTFYDDLELNTFKVSTSLSDQRLLTFGSTFIELR